MIHLSLRTEFTFRNCFGKFDEVINKVCKSEAIGLADEYNTFAHAKLHFKCKEINIKPIYGVRLRVVENVEAEYRQVGISYIFIAKNNEGLIELNKLVTKAYYNFYYKPLIGFFDVWQLSDNIIVIAEMLHTSSNMEARVDYLGLGPETNKKLLDYDLPRVIIDQNRFINPTDETCYELIADKRLKDLRPTSQHILNEFEINQLWNNKSAIANTYKIANECNVELVNADPIKAKSEETLEQLCTRMAEEKEIDLTDPIYKKRFDYELDLIKQKNFEDYFLIVADIVNKAKESMLVGPARGSSAGSLLTYITGITTVNPIEHGLLFERFIDINRHDLPDIDVDFPDKYRKKVIRQLYKTYGKDKVSYIGTVSRLKPKSAIGEASEKLGIPKYRTEPLKESIEKIAAGDKRSNLIATAFNKPVGKEFLEKHPQAKEIQRIENHARHSGIHAAGIIMSNDPLINYGSIDDRENVFMMENKEAYKLNLLKMDILGLRTLTILQDCAEKSGYNFSDYYDLPTNDQKVFDMFNTGRLHDIFQFNGYAVKGICDKIKIRNFEDLATIISLARPGPLQSGGTAIYIDRMNEIEEVEYMSKHPVIVETTKATLGIIVYQEQLMKIAKEYGLMTWKEVIELRKAAGKSLGQEQFNKYKQSFLKGTRSQNILDEEALHVWDNMLTFGAYGFNKSHAISYALISYWSAWTKVYYPLQFVVSNLNNTKDDDSALKILRDAVVHDSIEYVPVDPFKSEMNWSIQDNKVVGGLTNIIGIGEVAARKIIEVRDKENQNVTPGLLKKVIDSKTPFDVLFPCQEYWGDFYNNYESYDLEQPPSFIKDIQTEPGDYIFIGRLKSKELKDANQDQYIDERGYEIDGEPTTFLNLIFIDDTDEIMCQINRWKFRNLGQEIVDEGEENEDYYLVSGTISKSEFRFIFIQDIVKLGNAEESLINLE